MEDFELRVGVVEGRVVEQDMRIDDVRDAVSSLATRLGHFEERFDRRLEQFEQRMDRRFELVDQRFLGMEARLNHMNKLMIGMLIAVIGGMGGIITAILHR